MKKLLQLLKRFILFFVGSITLYLAMAVLLILIPTSPKPQQCEEKQRVYVASNGVHVDIIVPKNQLSPQLQAFATPSSNYLAFGWGDEGFYINTPTWNDLTFGTAVNALFMQSPSVVHITSYTSTYPHWQAVDLCEAQSQKLQEHIYKAFRKENGHCQLIEGAGYGSRDVFYEGMGSYHCFNTCNVWANEALQTADIPTAIWAPFDWGVMWHLE